MSSEVTQTAGFYEFLAWLEANKKRVIIGVAIIAVLALIVAFFTWNTNQREIEANAALIKLGTPSGGGESVAPPSGEDYLKVARRYPSTRAGERAALQAAGAFFAENKYPQALAQFKKFQADYSNSSLTPIAAVGIAACLEAQNQLDDAIKAYQDVASRYASDPEAGQAKLALGRLYQTKNQPELALKSYESVLGQNMRSSWASEASQQRELLIAKYPALATNRVSSPSPSTLSGTNIKATPTGTNPASAASTNTSAKPATNLPLMMPANTPTKTGSNGSSLPRTNSSPAAGQK